MKAKVFLNELGNFGISYLTDFDCAIDCVASSEISIASNI